MCHCRNTFIAGQSTTGSKKPPECSIQQVLAYFHTALKTAEAMMDGTWLEISFPEKHKTANICKLYLHRSANITDKYAEQNAF